MSIKALTFGLAALALAVPAAAQQRGTMEFGAFGSAGVFDKGLTLNQGVGGGGRIGVYLDPRVALEFEKGEMRASRTLGLKDVNVGILAGRLVLTPIRSGAVSILLGAGAGAGTETNFLHSYGVNALLGAKIALSDNAAIRVDAISDWLANNDWKSFQSLHVGLSFYRQANVLTRTVEVQVAAAPYVQRPDSVSAAEQARRRRSEQDYRNLRDSLAEHRAAIEQPVSSASARASMEQRIQFDFDKSDLSAAAKANLDEKVEVFRANPTMTILIVGHTGNMGTDAYNMALGTRRAEAAKAYLVSRDIDASRVQLESEGKSQPVVSPTAVGIAANAPNRRDMFQLVIVPDVIRKP